MIDEIVSMALGNGIWAALFCFLFLHMLKDSRNREAKYTETIRTLSEQVGSAISSLKICDDIKSSSTTNLQLSRTIKTNTEQIKYGIDSLRASWERL